MKKRIFLQSLICLLAVSCTVRELDVVAPAPTKEEADELIFYADLESSETDTRVLLDENIKILWDADDRISIFNKSTLNQQFRFIGEDQANSGEFRWVQTDEFGAGNDIDHIYAVYPYQESTTISNSDIMALTLPEEQTYREKSFGRGANTMVSMTDNNLLKFKNVGGYLALKFYGDDVSVSSIRLIGNNGEPLSGEGTIELPFDTAPEINMSSTAGKTILLNCEEPVQLGTTRDDATIFWMVVPPTDFTDGFTLLVTNPDGDVFVKETHVHLTIDRNGVLRIAPILVSMNSEGLSIDVVESADQEKLPSKTKYDNRTITVTMPTLNRSHLVLNYEFTGESLKANGLDVVNGETAVDVTKPVTLTVRSGNHGKNYTLIGTNTGLPVVRITTIGFDRSDLEAELNALKSADGEDHRTWHSGTTVRIEDSDGSPGMKNGNTSVYEINTQIKGRGNYTWIWDKKPYALKFDDKREVLGMPAHKRWILLANWRDHTLLRNDVTFELSRRAGLPYTVRGQFVELEFNGEYRGNYYLCEQIKIDENRVNITPFDKDFNDLTGGYLMEIDSYWDEVNKFHSKYFNLNYMFKEPDEDPSISGTDPHYALGYAWMENYINEFERVLMTESCVDEGEYENYLNVDSAILLMLLNEVTGNRDFYQGPPHDGPHSTYLYKGKIQDGERSKLFMGPGWDFDYETFISQSNINSNSVNGWRGFTRTGYYYHYLCYNQDFVDQVKSLWTSRKDSFLDVATDNTGYIDKMVEKIRLSQQFDAEKWPYKTSQENRNDNYDFYNRWTGKYYSFQEAISSMKTNFKARVSWMHERLNTTNGTFSRTSPSFTFETPNDWPTEE